jgi:uncharacterized membrane protein
MRPLSFRARQAIYDLRSGLLFLPALIASCFGALALVVPVVEARFCPALSLWLATEPAAAQIVLGTLAGSVMTAVSVIYSILLVALALASIQFSTRILAGMMRDRASQRTLGLFVGTFIYCLLTLRVVHADPVVVPGVSLTIAMLLALASLAGLVYFVHHIINAIQANHLVDTIATETEVVIDDVFPTAGCPTEETALPEPPADAVAVDAVASGYVQLIDVAGLGAVARRGFTVYVARGMGRFAAAGLPLAFIMPAEAGGKTPGAAELDDVKDAFDLGPVRTMQEDVEFGVRQIVDIALKAISPAVNDPSTAATCIDHLGRLLIRLAGRAQPVGVDGLVLPVATHADLVDLAFEQLRQYGRTDMAVALRLMRVLGEVASVTPPSTCLQRLERHARLLDEAARTVFAVDDCEELQKRRAHVRKFTGGPGTSSSAAAVPATTPPAPPSSRH